MKVIIISITILVLTVSAGYSENRIYTNDDFPSKPKKIKPAKVYTRGVDKYIPNVTERPEPEKPFKKCYCNDSVIYTSLKVCPKCISN